MFSNQSSNYIGIAYSGFGVPGHWWVITYTTIHMNTIKHMINVIRTILVIYFLQTIHPIPVVPDCILNIPCLLLHRFIRHLLLPLLYGIISWSWLPLLYGLLSMYLQLLPTVRGSVLVIPSRSLIINIYFCNTFLLLQSNIYYICVDKNNFWYIWLCNLKTIYPKLSQQKEKAN